MLLFWTRVLVLLIMVLLLLSWSIDRLLKFDTHSPDAPLGVIQHSSGHNTFLSMVGSHWAQLWECSEKHSLLPSQTLGCPRPDRNISASSNLINEKKVNSPTLSSTGQ